MEQGKFHVFRASSGSIGTTIFCVSGLILVLGAGAILAARGHADAE